MHISCDDYIVSCTAVSTQKQILIGCLIKTGNSLKKEIMSMDNFNNLIFQ